MISLRNRHSKVKMKNPYEYSCNLIWKFNCINRKIEKYAFEKFDGLKCLGVNINYKNDTPIEMNERIVSGNWCYFDVVNT